MTGKCPIPRFSAGALLLSSLLFSAPVFVCAQTPAPAKPVPAKPAPAKPVATVAKPAAAVPAKPATAVVARPAVVTNTTAAKPVATAPTTVPAATRAGGIANSNAARPGAVVATPVKAGMAVPATNGTSNVVQPASSRTLLPAGAAGVSTLPAATVVGGQSAAASATSYGNSGQRGAVVVPGAGSFLWGDWTLVAYGCFRGGGGSRVLCDFDATKQNGVQANANQMWGGLNLVDPNGKVTLRHTAFFLGDDGSQFETGYISTTPVRMFMEYDDVNPNVSTVTLVQGQNRVQGVNIMAVDPNAPPGSIPARAAPQAGQTAAQAGAPASGSPMDKAQQGINNVNNQIGNVNDQKTKAKGLWDQLKSTVQSTKQH